MRVGTVGKVLGYLYLISVGLVVMHIMMPLLAASCIELGSLVVMQIMLPMLVVSWMELVWLVACLHYVHACCEFAHFPMMIQMFANSW
jgi:hypothetical protein